MADERAAGEEPVEHFRPTSGSRVGWVGIVLLLALAVQSLSGGSLSAVAAAAGLGWCALGLWIGLVRPRVLAYGDHLLLRNELRDAVIPWHLVDGIVVRQTLRVHAGDDVCQCAAISRGARGRPRVRRATSTWAGPMFGVEGMVKGLGSTSTADPGVQITADYPDYVETRLRELTSQRVRASSSRPEVTTRWAAVPTAAFAAATAVAAALIGVAVG